MPIPSVTRLDPAGYFLRDGQRFFAVGVNYWPASSGLRMWAEWNETEIDQDLALISSLGLNTVRFFLRWQDFEPQAGSFDERQFDRLDRLLGRCAVHGLCAHPSLFVGWMSGGIFWPDWKAERNVFNDQEMVDRAESFVRRAALVFARHKPALLAVDLGNELDCLPDAKDSSRAEIGNWCARMCGAVREHCPEALIVSGCDHGQVVNDTPWTFDNQPGTDFLSMHAYPVPNWHPVPLGGLSDPLASRLFGLYSACARMHGPVLLQEFGSFLTHGVEVPQRFLQRAIDAAAIAGVNGLLWWCLHNVTDQRHPYAFNGMERTLGLVDSHGRVKPGLVSLVSQMAAWARDPRQLPQPSEPRLSIYVPDYERSPGAESLRAPNPVPDYSRRLIMAWHLAAEAGLAAELVGVRRMPEAGLRPLLLPGSCLHPSELAAVTDWVRAGGHLIWHGVPRMAWSPQCTELLGAHPVDFALACRVDIAWDGEVWECDAWPENTRLVVEPSTARVLARDSEGHPVLLRHSVERGTVTYTLHSIEDAARKARATSLAGGDRWHRWIAVVAALVSSATPTPRP